jgi:pyridoxal phosphate enzyme (YggS family)
VTYNNHFNHIVTKYQNILASLSQFTKKGHQPKLVLVTKNQPVELISKLGGVLNRPIFGENRVSEALPKISQCEESNITWHFIGHLQRNKVKRVIGKFSLIQSLTSIRLAREIEKRASHAELSVNCLLEIDICEDGSKHGFPPNMDLLSDAIQDLSTMPHINIKGLMTIAPFIPPEETRPYFRKMRSIFEELKEKHKDGLNVEMEILSMGMSNDYIVALEEGATMIRVGSAIFQEENVI